LTVERWHYMPLLKIKRGEKKALRAISPALRSRILPLVEVVERKAEKTVDAHLDNAFLDLADGLRLFERCLIDAQKVAPDDPGAAQAVFERAVQNGLRFTPVTGVSRSADVAAALANRSNGLALRITRREFEGGGLGGKIDAFLAKNALSAEQVDLVVDLGALDGLIAEGAANLTAEFLAVVPRHTAWRTFSVVACAFPKSMGVVDRNAYGIVERGEWKAWRDSLHARRQELVRLPAFGDCAIQHPLGVEGFDPKTMQASAAVRYTLPEDWLLIKGQGTRNAAPSTQFPRLARRLVSGDLSGWFAGPTHCAGCGGIYDAAQGAPKLGSPEAWRRLGTIHHITMVVEALTGLPWP
jgi:hypothetical protein